MREWEGMGISEWKEEGKDERTRKTGSKWAENGRGKYGEK